MADFWQGKDVLVTGSQGFMGKWLIDKLIEAGADPFGVDALDGDDVRDYSYMKDMLGYQINQHVDTSMDIVFHLAAISGVEHSRQLGMEAIDINVRGTYTILEAARQMAIKPLVLVATSNHVYGPQPHLPANEMAGLNQLDTYSASKICADVLTRAYWHNYGVPTAAIRNTNCFGPHSPHHDHIIEGAILSIIRGKKPVIKSNGFTKKSYMHVEDTIDAYMFIAEVLGSKYIPYGMDFLGEAWNVSGEPISVRDLVEMVCEVMDWKEGYEVLGECNDQSDEYMDTSKLCGLGWKPKWTLKEAIRDTAEWFIEHYSGNSS